MKKIEIKKASGSLAEYARQCQKNPILVVKEGKPVAAVVPIRNADAETTTLSTSQQFLAVIKRSRSRRKKEGGIASKVIRRRLGLSK